MIIADTNVVSEFMKDAPHPGVLRWAETLEPAEITICVVTVEEIERGLGRLPRGRRRRQLEERWASLLHQFAETIVGYDLAAARATALVAAERAGRSMHLADAQIAGICTAYDHVLATRNTRDFVHVAGLAILNPFEG